ncbi:MAG: hypothetical protein WCK25_03195 [Actinomycetes bacterium]
MAISEAPRVVRHGRAEWPALVSDADVALPSNPPHLFLLASASEEQVDRQAVQAVRRHAQQHRNMVGAGCLAGIGAVFGLAMVMVQLAQ